MPSRRASHLKTLMLIMVAELEKLEHALISRAKKEQTRPAVKSKLKLIKGGKSEDESK